MSYGYSVKLIELNKSADRRNLGVRLGRICIKHDVSVARVAARLGVSRQAVYNWFAGVSNPKPQVAKKIERYIPKLQR